jgi:hypothetical protein
MNRKQLVTAVAAHTGLDARDVEIATALHPRSEHCTIRRAAFDQGTGRLAVTTEKCRSRSSGRQ